jgi:hypothetical protein
MSIYFGMQLSCLMFNSPLTQLGFEEIGFQRGIECSLFVSVGFPKIVRQLVKCFHQDSR